MKTTKEEKEELIHEIAGLMFSKVPNSLIPEYIQDRVKVNCNRYGMCSEVMLESIHEAICMKLIDDYEVPK